MPTVAKSTGSSYTRAKQRDEQLNSLQADAENTDNHLSDPVFKLDQLQLHYQTVFITQDATDQHQQSVYSKTSAQDEFTDSKHLTLDALDQHRTTHWQTLILKDTEYGSHYESLHAYDLHAGSVFKPFHDFIDGRNLGCYSKNPVVDQHLCGVWGDGPGQQNFGWVPVDPYPGNLPRPKKNQILSVYFIMHTIAVVKLPERTEIEIASINMSLDIDSWSWQLSMNVLSKADADLIRPDINGVKEIEITIDGYLWEFIVESYSDNRRFGQSGYSVSGRSKTAYLAAPYQQPISFTETSQKTAIQLINDQLTGSGFTVNYNTVDWLVSANAFTYENKTSIQAIIQVAEAVGAVIKPHNSANEIDINARYPVSPWDWSSTLPVATVTEDVIRSLSGTWQPKQDINGVYVSGINAGVNCFVKRTGTNGADLAPQYLDDLITHEDAGREKGRTIISDRGKQELVTIELPVFPVGQQPQLFSPGDLLEIEETVAGTWKGQVIGVAISAARSGQTANTASQSLTIEKHYGNN